MYILGAQVTKNLEKSVITIFFITVEARFNEVPRDWSNWFVISRFRNIENLVIMNFLENNKSVRFIGVYLIIIVNNNY